MKLKTLFTIGLAAISLAGITSESRAQTNLTQVPNYLTNSYAPTLQGGAQEVWDALTESGLNAATNFAVEPYLTYAPKAPEKFGGGLLLPFNLNKYVAPALGVDYLGQFSLVSANITLKLPIEPFAQIALIQNSTNGIANFLKTVRLTPFVLGGFGKPLGGSGNDNISTITDAGLYLSFGHLWGGQFNLGAAYGEWENAGLYSGKRYHFFFGYSFEF